MRGTDFSFHLTDFLANVLPKQRNFSDNTIASYSYALRLFLKFCRQQGIDSKKFQLKNLTASLVLGFLEWMETERNCSIATRNQRLAAIHTFIDHVITEVPENLYELVKIQKIPYKETPERIMEYLSVEDMTLVLSQPDTKTPKGRQHYPFEIHTPTLKSVPRTYQGIVSDVRGYIY